MEERIPEKNRIQEITFLRRFLGREYFFDDRFIYILDGEKLEKLAFFSDRYYKLRMFKNGAVLEIDGLRMQLLKEFQHPKQYAKKVVKAIGIRKGDVVLDTCMGLGYTAGECAEKASLVITCEKSKDVVNLALLNPFGEHLRKENIRIYPGSVWEFLKLCKSRTFDRIVHDPPRISLSPELYSREVYVEMNRVLKPGGVLFHYVGSMKKGRYTEGIIKRIKSSGFESIKKWKRLQGVTAKKPADDWRT